MRIFQSIAVALFVTVTYLPVVYAGDKSNKKPSINININPKDSQAEQAYQQTIQGLTADQKKLLKDLDTELVSALEPQFTISSTAEEFLACKKLDPSIQKSHGKMFETLRFTQMDKMQSGWGKFGKVRAKIDFVERKMLNAHISFQKDLTMQLFMGTLKAATNLIAEGKRPEACAELKQKLEKEYSNDYVVLAKYSAPKTKIRRAPNGRIVSCGIGFGHFFKEKSQISNSLILMDSGARDVVLDFSTKIFQDGKFIPIDKTWMSFGSYDTRFQAQHGQPNPNIIIGTMPTQGVLHQISYMKSNNVISSAKSPQWKKAITFMNPPVPQAELSKFSNCVAALEPKFAGALGKIGFKITPDQKHQSALKAKPKQ